MRGVDALSEKERHWIERKAMIGNKNVSNKVWEGYEKEEMRIVCKPRVLLAERVCS